MILTVTPNPAVDMTYRVDKFEAGETIRVDTGLSRAGGKGLNVARVARQVGRDNLALTTVGGSTGVEFRADVTASGLEHELVPVDAATRRTIAIVDRSNHSTTIMTERGGRLSPQEWQGLLAGARAQLQSAATSCVVGSGSLPPGVPDAFYADLVSAAAEHDVPTVIDAVGPALMVAAEAGAHVLKPNRRELRATTGEDDPVAGAHRLISAGAHLILVSLGEDGMLAVSAQEPRRPLHARLPRTLNGNPTGAGDAAVAAIAVTISDRCFEPDAILRRATAWSAAAVLMPIAGELADNYPELEELLTVTPWAGP